MRRIILPFLALVMSLAFIAAPADAAEEAPRAIVQRLNAALLHVMQNAANLGLQGRYDFLAPVLEATFAFSEMARIATGQHWSRLGPEQQAKLVERFTEMSTTTFAARFDGYSGERFEVLGEEGAPRGRTLVRSQIVKASGETVPLNYVFTEIGGEWRAVDVYLQGTISELAIYRSEFVSVLSREGYDGLMRRIDEKIARLKG